MNSITNALNFIRNRIADAERAHGRPPGSVRLIAVSKTHPPAAVKAAFEAGQRAFGENQLQDAMTKVTATEGMPIEWHFIGPVQSNKTRPIATHFHWVHTVDRTKVARRLSEQRPESLPRLNVCIQINVSGEQTKSGVSPEEALPLARAISDLPRLRLRGLMAIPQPCVGFEAQRQALRPLATLFAALREEGLALDALSMGMTDDLEAAIAEGATMVRIGTAIFGPRQQPSGRPRCSGDPASD